MNHEIDENVFLKIEIGVKNGLIIIENVMKIR